MPDGQLILVAGALLAAALAASLLAGRIRVPGLVLFLGLGMAIGSDGLGWIEFGDYERARTIGVVALALILFEGGLTAGFHEIRPVLRTAIGLATVGTIVTAVITGLVAAWLFDLSTLEGLLLGSIFASTDGAAIFALLRGSTLRRKLARTLEGEAGLNDPIAVLLVVGFIDWIEKPGYGLIDMVGLFAQQIGIGLAAGLGVGWLAVQGLRRISLATAGLYPVATIATAALAFGAADVLHGSGFLAVYLAGLMLGSASIPAKSTVTTFHQGLGWVAQLSMFMVLGLLVFPRQLGPVALEGTALALVLVLVARPVSTLLATIGAHFDWREKAVIGWAGLRGAVPVVLATFPVIENVPGSVEFFNIVFFAVIVSTLLQGTTFEPLAERLGVTTSEPALPRPLTEAGTIRRLGAEVIEYPVGAEDAVVGRRVRQLGLPREALLNVIVRGGQAIPPRGSTLIEAHDRLHVLVRQEVAAEMRLLTERWQYGPFEDAARRRRRVRGAGVIFSARPWSEDDGDPARPQSVLGVAVAEHLRTRRDQPGALVALEDGRFAATGLVVAVGAPQQVQAYCRRRLDRSSDQTEQAWWQEVVGALAAEGSAGTRAPESGRTG
ncbi:MAG: potassium/hydrogen antiporter [Thermoleophilaceae bacterium]|jgi:cell volume regulation protein A|nr:potassium/hydrogen antiporter [Thermoleophilaceae bacterium]